jgi:hypothetical protein
VRAKAGLTILAATLLAAITRATADTPRPQTIDHGSDLGAYSLAGNARGDRAVAVAQELTPGPAGVDVLTAPAGAHFGPATRLRGNNVPASDVAAALGPDGTLAIVGEPEPWPPPNPHRLMAVVRPPPGGSFGKPAAISAGGVADFSVAFDRNGAAMAIWTRDSPNPKSFASYVEESTLPPGGAWSKPSLISYERRGAASPQVAFDAAGGAVAAWTREGSPLEAVAARKPPRFENEVVAATRSAGAGAAFARPQVVSDPRFNSDEGSLSVNSSGQAAIAWVLNTRNDAHFRVGASFRDPGERFGPPQFLTPDGRDSCGASIALDDRGRALVVWAIPGAHPNMETSTTSVRAAVRPHGGPLGKPFKLSDRHAGFPEMAMDPDGHAVAAWVRESNHGFLVQARRVRTSGAYGQLATISPRGDVDDLATTVDEGGTGLVIWRRGGAHQRIQAAAVAP